MLSVSAPELALYKRVVTSTNLVEADICDLLFRLLLLQTRLTILNERRLHWPVYCPLLGSILESEEIVQPK